jgi:hypothetical protein
MYTVHGALMVCGGTLFGWSIWRAAWLPRGASALFLAGLVLNLALALLPVADIWQTLGSALRNLGLMSMGYAILRLRP